MSNLKKLFTTQLEKCYTILQEVEQLKDIMESLTDTLDIDINNLQNQITSNKNNLDKVTAQTNTNSNLLDPLVNAIQVINDDPEGENNTTISMSADFIHITERYGEGVHIYGSGGLYVTNDINSQGNIIAKNSVAVSQEQNYETMRNTECITKKTYKDNKYDGLYILNFIASLDGSTFGTNFNAKISMITTRKISTYEELYNYLVDCEIYTSESFTNAECQDLYPCSGYYRIGSSTQSLLGIKAQSSSSSIAVISGYYSNFSVTLLKASDGFEFVECHKLPLI